MNDSQLQIIISAKDLASKTMQGVSKETAALQKGMDSFAKGTLNTFNQGFEAAAGAIKIAAVAGGIAAAAFVGYGANLAISYEKQLSAISALTGGSKSQMTAVSNLALTLGAKTKYSALEAAQGIEELLKAGVSLESVMGGAAAGALDLAAAGGLSVADAAEIASTALNAFKKDALSVSQAADILAGAANASATDVSQLRFALSMSSAVAAGVGFTFKDTSAALAVFAQNGLKGSDAGTSLKTMLLNLIPSTDKQNGLFEELGLLTEKGSSAFFDAAGKVKSLADISGLLQDKLKGLTDEQRINTLERLFGSDAIRAANILYKEGSEGIVNMANSMSKFTAADVAKERMNNLAGAIETFRGTIDTIIISVFKMPLPWLTDNLKGVTDAFNTFGGAVQILTSQDLTATFETLKAGGFDESQVQNMKNMSSEIQNFGQKVKETLEPAFIFLKENPKVIEVALVGLASVVGGVVVGAFVNMAIAVAAATWPFVLLAAAVGGLFYIFETNTGVRDFLTNTWNVLVKAFDDFKANILPILKQKLDEVMAWFTDNGPKIQSFLDSTWTNLVKGFNDLSKWVNDNRPALENFGVIIAGFAVGFGAVWAAIQLYNIALAAYGFVTGAVTIVTAVFGAAVVIATSPLFLIALAIGAVVAAGFLLWKNWELLSMKATEIFSVISGFIGDKLNEIKTNFQGAMDTISQHFSNVFETIKIILATAFLIIIGLFTGNSDLIREAIIGLGNSLTGIWGDTVNRIMDKINGLKRQAIDTLNGLSEGAKTSFNSLINWFGTIDLGVIGRNIILTLGNGLQDGFKWAINAVSNSIDNLVNKFRSIDLQQMGKDTIQGFIRGITNMANAVRDAIGGVIGGSIDWAKKTLGIQSPSKVFMEIGDYTMKGWEEGMTNYEPMLQSTTSKIANNTAQTAATGTTPTTNTNNQQSFGNITIQINQQPGQSSQGLAQQVMDALSNRNTMTNLGLNSPMY